MDDWVIRRAAITSFFWDNFILPRPTTTKMAEKNHDNFRIQPTEEWKVTGIDIPPPVADNKRVFADINFPAFPDVNRIVCYLSLIRHVADR